MLNGRKDEKEKKIADAVRSFLNAAKTGNAGPVVVFAASPLEKVQKIFRRVL